MRTVIKHDGTELINFALLSVSNEAKNDYESINRLLFVLHSLTFSLTHNGVCPGYLIDPKFAERKRTEAVNKWAMQRLENSKSMKKIIELIFN